MRGVSFDLDGTLYDYARSHRAGLARAARAACRWMYFHELAVAEGDRAPLLVASKPERAYWEGFYAVMEPLPGVLDVLALFRRQSFRLAVTTDMTTAIQCEKLERLRLHDFFDVVVTSEEAGHEKPHPAIFALSCKRLGLRPCDIVHIGDDYARDARGARAAGMKAIWFSPSAAAGRTAMRAFVDLPALL